MSGSRRGEGSGTPPPLALENSNLLNLLIICPTPWKTHNYPLDPPGKKICILPCCTTYIFQIRSMAEHQSLTSIPPVLFPNYIYIHVPCIYQRKSEVPTILFFLGFFALNIIEPFSMYIYRYI